MDFISATLETTLDEVYRQLLDCNFELEDRAWAMFLVALMNGMESEGGGNRPTDVVLLLAFGESDTANRCNGDLE